MLDASLELFAQKGFAETSLRDISRRSGVSHSLMLHHFRSKEALYEAVKRRVVEGYAARFPAAARSADRPIDFHVEMKRIMTYVGENELALKLCARTRIDEDHQVWPGEPDLFDLLQQGIESAQRVGAVRDDLPAERLTVMILGLVIFWLDNRKHFATRFGRTIADDDYLETAVRMVESGVRPGVGQAKAERSAAARSSSKGATGSRQGSRRAALRSPSTPPSTTRRSDSAKRR